MKIIASMPFKHVPIGSLIFNANENCLELKIHEALYPTDKTPVDHVTVHNFDSTDPYRPQEGGLGYYNEDAEVLVVSKDFLNGWRKEER